MGNKLSKIVFTEQEKEEYKQITLSWLKNGKYCYEIADHIGVSATTISRIRDLLIAEGKITSQDIELVRDRRKEEEKKLEESKKDELSKTITQKSPKPVVIDESLKQRILELLLNGVYQPTIRKIVGLDSADEYEKIKEELIKNGCITRKKINIAAQEKRKRDKEKVFKFLLLGYSQRDITSNIEHTSLKAVQKMISELVDEGRITKEQINEYRYEEEGKIRKYILSMLKQGYTCQEIADLDENGYLTESNVRRYKRIMISEGLIKDKQIKRAKKLRKPYKDRERKISEIDPYDEKILMLIKLGFEQKKIASIIGMSEYYVNARKKILVMRDQITNAEVTKRRKSIEDMANKRRTRIIDAMGEDEELDIQTVQEHIEYCKAKMQLNKEQKEDLKLLSFVIQNTPELITAENINFIITYYTRNNNMQESIKFINECLSNCKDDPKIRKKLLEAQKAITLNMKRRDAASMLRLGYMPLDVIRDETGLSMQEILELKEKMKNDKSEVSSIGKER